MNRLHPALAAACLSLFAAVAMAQSPSGDAGKGPMGGPGGPGGPHQRMKPCSQEADPAKCEANRKEMRERMKSAHEACKDKPDRRACMTEQYCSKATDKAQCEAKAKERQAMHAKRMDAHQAAAEACTGKRGDELQKCMQAQRGKSGPGGTDKK